MQFIEMEAEVDEEDEEEGDEDEELPEETHPDDLLDLPPGAERDDRRHRELDRKRELEASMDAEKQAAAYKERYGRTRTSAVDSVVVPQRLLLPSVSDPTIWGVRVKPGKEMEVVFAITKRFDERKNSRAPLGICSAFERGGTMAGYVYVEARKQADVMEACENISFCYPRTNMVLIPINEMPDLLRVTKSKELEPGMYVRMKRPPLYAGDLAEVIGVEQNGLDVTVRIVPRLDYGLNEDNNGPAQAQKRTRFGKPIFMGPRPPQRLFNEAEAKKKHMKYLSSNSTLGKRAWTYRNENYEDGYLIKDVKINWLQAEDVNPTLEEVTKFATGAEDGTDSLDLAALAATLKSNTSGAAYLPGDMVEIYQGEQQGVYGKAISVHGDIVTLEVLEGYLKGQTIEAPVKTLRKKFKEGDHVKVIGGSKYHDEVGLVIKTKDDRVTLLTDSNNQEITVFSKDLRVASASTNLPGVSKYDLYDLVQLEYVATSTSGILLLTSPVPQLLHASFEWIGNRYK
jgi:transcription elongation factor SPT5